jgi:hypothetical protein
MRELRADIVIIGGGTGGVAAALAALECGRTVILTEETDWIGGQLTAQMTPPDEHRWIESCGCTRRYRRLRDDIRDYYRRFYSLTEAARSTPCFNPGGASVSRISHEPRVSLAILQSYLQPHLASGKLSLLLEHAPLAATTDGDRVLSVTVRDLNDGEDRILCASYFLDATELGELLELAHVEAVIGAESQAETGEPHAVPGAPQPLNQQAFSHVLALSHHAGEDHTISRPAEYSFWQNYQADFWPDRNLSWQSVQPATLAPRALPLFAPDDAFHLFRYRRVLDTAQHRPGSFSADITTVNWPQTDYWLGPLLGVTPEAKQRHLAGAKALSLCFLYWMQTEAPRSDGGAGYPGLKLRGDVTGTRDGLAKYPYIRESRRIQAEFTVLEQHVASELRPGGAEKFSDSVGVGCYRIDLHPSSSGANYIDIGSQPFQIPLGSLLPVRVENLLPACKNLGVTHITNGCYRLHPVEWNIGEAAGLLAAYCLEKNLAPRAVRHHSAILRDFQNCLEQHGIELDWPQLHSV